MRHPFPLKAAMFAAMLLLPFASGCTTDRVPASDPELARELLSQVLANWKAGRSVDELRESTPPIFVSDDLWQPSFELQEFTILGPGERYGTNVRLRAKLRGVGEKNKSVETEVRYLVTTVPAITIAREDR